MIFIRNSLRQFYSELWSTNLDQLSGLCKHTIAKLAQYKYITEIKNACQESSVTLTFK